MSLWLLTELLLAVLAGFVEVCAYLTWCCKDLVVVVAAGLCQVLGAGDSLVAASQCPVLQGRLDRQTAQMGALGS